MKRRSGVGIKEKAIALDHVSESYSLLFLPLVLTHKYFTEDRKVLHQFSLL